MFAIDERNLLRICFSALLGLFVFQTVKGDHFSFFRLSWDKSIWITPSQNSSVGVFRFKFYLAQNPYIIWMQVAATDTYKFYVNGHLIDEKAFYSECPSSIYNLTPYVQPGLNVIGIVVRRWSFPGKPMILVKGAYKYSVNSPFKFFYSNSSWRALTREDKNGRIPWTVPLFNDEHWPHATEVYKNTPKPYPLFFPSDVISTSYKAHVISATRSIKDGFFEGTFFLKEKPDFFSLRLNASHKLDLIINGLFIGSFYSVNKMQVLLLSSSLLNKGKNRIRLVFHSDKYIIPSLYADIIIGKDKTTHFLYGQPQWNLSFIYPKWKLVNNAGIKISINKLTNGVLSNLPNLNTEITFVSQYPFLYYIKPIVYGVITFLISIFLCFSIPLRSYWLFYLPTIFMFFLLIIAYDVRISANSIFCFSRIFDVLLLLVIGLIIDFMCRNKKRLNIKFGFLDKRLLLYIIFIFLLVLCSYFRIRDLGVISLNGDEIGTVRFALNILKKGYPYIELGNLWKPATTYELLPYPIALVLSIFKTPSEFIVRLPSFLFSIMTLGILFYISLTLFSLRCAISVSLIYIFMPLEINMAQNARYIQIEQFWLLLTIFFYYKGIQESKMHSKYLYLSALFFSIAYLFWEGFGYLLPSLCITTFFVKWNDWKWIRSWDLWFAATLSSLVVLIQLIYRTHWSLEYLVVGTGISDSAFKFMPLYQVYDPWYYFKVLFLNQYNYMLSIVLIIFSIIIIKSRDLIFLALVLICICTLLSNTFSIYSSRYIYFVQPLYLLLIFASIDKFLKRNLAFFLLVLLLFFATNDYFLKLYRLSPNPYPQSLQGLYLKEISEMRHNIYQVDFKACNLYVKDHLLKDDVVISVYSHPTLFYAGKLDYFLQSITDTQLVCLDDHDNPRLANKTVDVPTIRNLSELKEVLKRHKRVWFVLSSYELFTLINDQKIIDFINTNTQPVYESYRCRVYLWERRFIQ